MAEYYASCAFPKPGSQKKKKVYNGYKNKPNRVCAYCGERCAERHEVFGGPNRKFSIINGLQVDVCNDHHRQLQDNVTEWGKQENARLRRRLQLQYMKNLMSEGLTGRQALNDWMQNIGRNYVQELMP